jgi:hypothetical protein
MPGADDNQLGTWSRITEAQTDKVFKNLLLFKAVAVEEHDQEHQQILQAAWSTIGDLYISGEREFSPEKTLKLNGELSRLAGLAYRTSGMREPDVFVQRGNDPRVVWPKTSEGSAE